MLPKTRMYRQIRAQIVGIFKKEHIDFRDLRVHLVVPNSFYSHLLVCPTLTNLDTGLLLYFSLLQTQIVTPIRMKKVPSIVCIGFGKDSPKYQLVQKVKTNAKALQMGTAILNLELAKRM
jgi:hypothetical protein